MNQIPNLSECECLYLFVFQHIRTEDEYIREKFVYGKPLYNPKKGAKRAEHEQHISAYVNGTSYSPKCPTCGSPQVEKIGFVERGASVATFGLFSKKIGKSYKCKGCGMSF